MFSTPSLILRNKKRYDISILNVYKLRAGETVDLFLATDKLSETVVVEALRVNGSLYNKIYVTGEIELITINLLSYQDLTTSQRELLEADTPAEQRGVLGISELATNDLFSTGNESSGTLRVVAEVGAESNLDLIQSTHPSYVYASNMQLGSWSVGLAGSADLTMAANTYNGVRYSTTDTYPSGALAYASNSSVNTARIQSIATATLRSFADNGSIVLGVGSLDHYYISTDNGETWYPRFYNLSQSSTSFDFAFVGVVVKVKWDGNRFIILTDSSECAYSYDGLSWTLGIRISNSIAAWTDLAFGNGVYVATSSSGYIATSSDLITWSIQLATAYFLPGGVAFGAGIFVILSIDAATINKFATSNDGLTWIYRASPNDEAVWKYIEYGAGKFVAVTSAISASSNNFIATSDDGIAWSFTPTMLPGQAPTAIVYANGIYVTVSSSGSLFRAATSTDGYTWVSRTTPIGDNNWTSVTYGAGLFVAVSSTGSGNRVMTSADGITWVSRTSAADLLWKSITYGAGLFVAVSQSTNASNVMTSADGITWISRATPNTNQWNSVVYAAGLFVAVGQSGTGNRVMTSADGITWASRTSAANNTWNSVTYGAGLFVAVSSTGTGNRIMTSPDGITWTSRTSPVDLSYLSVAYGAGIFVAVGSSTNNTLYSFDGITWYIGLALQSSTQVIYDGSRFVAVGTTSSKYCSVSADGIFWSLTTTSGYSSVSSLQFHNGKFILSTVNSAPALLISSNGTDWAQRPLYPTIFPDTFIPIVAVWHKDDVYVATELITSSSSNIHLSMDGGFTWTFQGTEFTTSQLSATNFASSGTKLIVLGASDPILASTNYVQFNCLRTLGTRNSNGYNHIFYANNKFIAVGTGVAALSYDDGVTWRAAGAIPVFGWRSVAYGAGLFVAVASSGTGNRVMTSPDGYTWTSRASSLNTNAWQSIIYAAGQFVAIANSGTNRVMTSPDGITWTGRASANESATWTQITYGNGIYVAVGEVGGAGVIMTSTDGISWTLRTLPAREGTMRLYAIAYGAGRFVAGGDNSSTIRSSSLITSADGINWTYVDNPLPQMYVQYMIYDGARFIAGGTFKTSQKNLMYSDDGLVWITQTTMLNCPVTDMIYLPYENEYDPRMVFLFSNGMSRSAFSYVPDQGTLTAKYSYRGNFNSSNHWNALAYGNSMLVAVSITGAGDRVAYSTDKGMNWTIGVSPADNEWRCVKYGNGVFVAIASSGSQRVMTSTDGITWTLRDAAVNNKWWSLAYGAGIFVAVSITGSGDQIMTSTDGITWTTRATAYKCNWKSVVWNGRAFVAIADASAKLYPSIMFSSDGITWNYSTYSSDASSAHDGLVSSGYRTYTTGTAPLINSLTL